jgi:hypothetical protein
MITSLRNMLIKIFLKYKIVKLSKNIMLLGEPEYFQKQKIKYFKDEYFSYL